jgi:hypothetical protein
VLAKRPATRKSSAPGRKERRRPRLSDSEKDPCRLAGVLSFVYGSS